MIFKLYSKKYETLIFKVCSKGQTQNKPYLNRSQFFTFRNTSSKCTSILFRGFKGIVKRDFFFHKKLGRWVVVVVDGLGRLHLLSELGRCT